MGFQWMRIQQDFKEGRWLGSIKGCSRAEKGRKRFLLLKRNSQGETRGGLLALMHSLQQRAEVRHRPQTEKVYSFKIFTRMRWLLISIQVSEYSFQEKKKECSQGKHKSNIGIWISPIKQTINQTKVMPIVVLPAFSRRASNSCHTCEYEWKVKVH